MNNKTLSLQYLYPLIFVLIGLLCSIFSGCNNHISKPKTIAQGMAESQLDDLRALRLVSSLLDKDLLLKNNSKRLHQETLTRRGVKESRQGRRSDKNKTVKKNTRPERLTPRTPLSKGDLLLIQQKLG